MSVPSLTRTRDESWLYAALLLLLESVYGWSLFTISELRAPLPFSLFTLLMALHGALHLSAPRLVQRRGWLIGYFVIQSAMAFTFTWLTSANNNTFGLYLYDALAAQAVGLLYGRVRAAVTMVLGYLALALVNFVWLWGWAPLPAFLVWTGPQALLLLAFVVLFFRQSRARQQAQALLAELETAHCQLAAYAAQIADLTLAAERQRMARELHDTLAQGVAGLILQLEAMDGQLARGHAERAQAIAHQAMARARTTLAEARQAISDLRSMSEHNLCEVIAAEVERFTSATGIPCEFKFAGAPTLPEPLCEHAPRMVAECLRNIAQHAHAQHAWVELKADSETLRIIVRDDGVGFDPSALTEYNGHYGLLGLRERARLLNGSLEIVSAPQQGARVTLHLDLSGFWKPDRS
jgi:NarL family two-component system sensor histidine kinase YdfH